MISNHLAAARNVVTEPVSARDPPRFRFSPDDVVVVSALRTPIGKSRKGVFKVRETSHLAFLRNRDKL